MPTSPRPRTPELLAPAGDFAAACAALHYGADAIYAGLARFSARADAANLTPAQLRRAIALAHGRTPPARVYAALNTLVQEHELPAAADALEDLDDAGVDAVIVQDLGVARLARRCFPRLRLHASTQLVVHSAGGARALADLGFRRVVLARELTLDESARIAAEADIETEIFVHGALCYSYSGLCLFSSHRAGRSGNRGRCAYCCREPFAPVGADGRRAGRPGFPFSMRDLALAPLADRLRRSGAAGLKIEGRMKSALYVAAVTDFYRRKLDGALDGAEEAARVQDLQTIFSRPWTQFYAAGRDTPAAGIVDPSAVGHRGAPIGAVEAVARERDGAWLRFRAARALEKHDGLQIELPAGGKPFGFAVLDLRRAGSRRPEVGVPAGTTVEVRLPPDETPPIPSGAPVFCSASQAVRCRYEIPVPRASEARLARPVSVTAALRPGGLTLRARAADDPSLAAEVAVPAALVPARQPGGTEAAVRRALARSGDTPWQVSALEVDDPHGLYASPAALNEARRMLFDRLAAAHEARRAVRREEARCALHAAPAAVTAAVAGGGERWTAKFHLDGPPCAPAGEADDVVLLLGRLSPQAARQRLRDWLGFAPRERLRLALPAIARGQETHRHLSRNVPVCPGEAQTLRATVEALLAEGWGRWEFADLAGARLLREAGAPPDRTADWSCYGLNRLAREQWAELGARRAVASPEDTAENLAALAASGGPELEVVVWQHTPLFLSETAPVTAGAAAPEDGIVFEDRRGGRIITRRLDGRWVTVAREPFCLAAHLDALRRAGVRWFRADFSWSPAGAAEPAAAWRDLRGGRAPAGTHTANFSRGLA